MWCGASNRAGIGAGSLGFIPSGVALTIRSMSASCARTAALVPSHGFEPRDRTKYARFGEERPQPIYKGACLCRSAIDQDQALTIFQRALPGYGMTCASAGTKDHHSQIAQID